MPAGAVLFSWGSLSLPLRLWRASSGLAIVLRIGRLRVGWSVHVGNRSVHHMLGDLASENGLLRIVLRLRPLTIYKHRRKFRYS